MTLLHATPKIRPEHLARQAFIYVRQSTLAQVRRCTASTARQYDLAGRARRLGWPEEALTTVDEDQGQSGASRVGRDGFQRLVAAVGLGHVGAVFSLEASRLARQGSDWHRLLEICALTDTLVIDEEGIYNPSQYNDRLLLGFKGTMSEAELHWLRQRLLGGKLEKARKGKLRVRLPAGLVYDAAGAVAYDPDEQVREVVRLLFALFDERGSALAVVKRFADRGLLFPTRFWGGARDGELLWRPLRHGRVLSVLHNPAYAGAYVYGRTKSRQKMLPEKMLPGEAPRTGGRTRQVKPSDWPIVVQDAYPAYISWEQFLRNRERLDDNRTFRGEERRGASREGAALLQGIVLCGRCGRRMSVRYRGCRAVPSYECNQVHSQLGGRACQSIRGDHVDAAVAKVFLEAIRPAQLQVSVAALGELEERARQIDRQWELRLERARYEADLAVRRYRLVEPENRLVARSLERDWNEKLTALEGLKREHAARVQHLTQACSAEERERILALAQDLPTVWRAETTTQAERKRLLRFLIRDVTLTKKASSVHVGIRWQTEATTELKATRPRPVYERKRTPAATVERVRELAPTHADRQIADQLGAEGRTTGTGGRFTKASVSWIRYAYSIRSGCPEAPGACPGGQRGDGRYSAKAAAELLNVDVSTIAAWCREGRLDCVRGTPRGPRWIKLTSEEIAALRKPVRQRWRRHSEK